MTMVYVTHDQTEAMTMADRVVLMRDGRIEQNGPPEQLYSRPATAFTARFIGTPPMNLIARGGSLIGIRPEHIRIVSQDGHAARVRSVEHLGADSIVLCEIDGSAGLGAAGRLQQGGAGRRDQACMGGRRRASIRSGDAATRLRSRRQRDEAAATG